MHDSGIERHLNFPVAWQEIQTFPLAWCAAMVFRWGFLFVCFRLFCVSPLPPKSVITVNTLKILLLLMRVHEQTKQKPTQIIDVQIIFLLS